MQHPAAADERPPPSRPMPYQRPSRDGLTRNRVQVAPPAPACCLTPLPEPPMAQTAPCPVPQASLAWLAEGHLASHSGQDRALGKIYSMMTVSPMASMNFKKCG